MVPLLEVGGKEWGNAHDTSHDNGCDWGCYFMQLTSISPCGKIVKILVRCPNEINQELIYVIRIHAKFFFLH